ncbi:MAG TPA: DUF4097 family beta strand repeat-containing protein [Gemmatimonadaceae bacterium]|jgi:hypothetical protein
MNRITRFTLFAATAAAMAVPSSACAQRDREPTRVDSTFAFDKGSWLEVGIVSGEVVVTGWTRAEAKVYATTEHGWFDAQLSSHRITLMTRSDHGRSGHTRVEIMVPVGTRVQVSTVSGRVQVTGTQGEVDAGSVNGTVEVIGATDRITAHTVNGRVHAAKLSGRVRLSTTNDRIEAEDIAGDVTAESVSGRITLTGVKSSHVSAETVSGTVSYEGNIDPAGSYELSTHSGGVHMTIPDGSSANLELETFSGHISSAFPITLQPGEISSMSTHGKKMEFTIGKGGARISASTFSGNITIDKSGHTDREEN